MSTQDHPDTDGPPLFGFAQGEVVEAAHDIIVGCPEGTRLRIVGPSGNPRHPVAVVKEYDPSWQIGVSVGDLRKTVPFSPRYLVVSRRAVGREVVIRVSSEDGTQVDQLNDAELASVRAALREYGIRQLGDTDHEET